jgi:hypothetical protein
MTRRIFALALALAPAFACGGAAQRAEPGQATMTTAAGASDGAHVCPMAVMGARASVVDVVGGVAIDFTTTGSSADVQELARRLHHMHDAKTLGTMAGPSGGRGRRGALRSTAAAAPADVRLEDIPRGVRVVLVARDRAQIDALRTRARQHVSRMGGGECARASS